jgi:myo-inositol-1(or 4)-monophosphatase
MDLKFEISAIAFPAAPWNNRVMAYKNELQAALAAAIKAARIAGQIIRKNWQCAKTIKSAEQHDIKLELDVRCQQLIVRSLQPSFPHFAILGEEGVSGDPAAAARWVVDPIDGTVNFAYDIPHACVSIALQTRCGKPKPGVTAGDYQTQVGVVYDPFCEELWTAIRGQPARLNGKIIHASRRTNLAEAVVAVGFAKYDQNLQKMLPSFQNLAHRVRKLRIMGSAALDLVYVASGRFDAYLESGVRLWDIAAGGLILECAGGDFLNRPISADHHYYVLANNGPLRRKLQRLTK